MNYKEIQARINALYQLLTRTDYIDNKITEALVLGGMEAAQAVAAEYTEELTNRKAWREELSELEDMPIPESEPESEELGENEAVLEDTQAVEPDSVYAPDPVGDTGDIGPVVEPDGLQDGGETEAAEG